MFKFLISKIWGAPAQSDTTLSKIVDQMVLNRRKHLRVLYPSLGAFGHLPKVSIDGNPIEAHDISLGGIGLIDDREQFKLALGENLILSLSWPGHKVEQKAQLVAINGARRHIQFKEIAPETLVYLNKLIRPGYIGSQLRAVAIPQSGFIMSAQEVWVGANGENFMLEKSPEGLVTGKLYYNRMNIELFSSGKMTFREPIRGFSLGQELPAEFAKDILVCVANMVPPSEILAQVMTQITGYLKGA